MQSSNKEVESVVPWIGHSTVNFPGLAIDWVKAFKKRERMKKTSHF